MSDPIWRKGDLITCENGHVIGEALEDVFLHQHVNSWGDCFGNWRQDHHPVVGSMDKPVCAVCGANFLDPQEGSWRMHAGDGWRPKVWGVSGSFGG
jgi:hypothetical protein